ncbi:MAG: NAD-dependent epimerase/dehydratase family protein [Candidatus Kariarchaeaceae archaeon]
MKILVTGATGYLGGHLCEYLQKKGHEITGFIRNPKKADLLDTLSIPYKIGDITDVNTLRDAMKEGFDAVINSSGYVSDRGSWKLFRAINVEGTENVARAMKTTGIKRLIQMSSIASYGQLEMGATEELKPKKPRWFKYGVTKLEAEEALQTYTDIKTTYIRPGHVVGRRDRTGFIPVLYHTMRKKPRWINHGKAITGLVYVDDVCHAVELCLENDETIKEGYNLVTPEQVSIRGVVEFLHKEMNTPIPTVNMGFRRLYYTAAIIEFLGSIFKFKLPMTRMPIVLAGHDFHVSSAKISDQLGWKSSKSIEEMLKEWTDWRTSFEEKRKNT